MQKNQIIPQMFDVRPVDETGNLDWQKIKKIGGKDQYDSDKQVFLQSEKQQEVVGKTYIMGVPVDSNSTPIFYDPNFNIKKIVPEGTINKKLKISDSSYVQEKIRQEEILRQEKIKIEAEKKYQRQQEYLERVKLEKQQQQLRIQQQRIAEQARESELEKQRLARVKFEKEQKELQIQKAENERMEKEKSEKAKLAQEERELAQAQKAEDERLAAIKLEKFKRAQSLRVAHEKKKFKFSKRERSGGGVKLKELFFPKAFSLQFELRHAFATFLIPVMALSLGFAGISFASKSLGMKGKVLGVSADGYANLTGAVSDMAHQNFEGSSEQFSEALDNFSQGSAQIQEMGGVLLDVTKYIPFASKISSGKNAVEAGKHFSAAGKSLNEVAKIAAKLKEPTDEKNQVTLLDVFQTAKNNLALAKSELDSAQKNIDQISIDDLPKDKQQKFLLLKQKLPDIRKALDLFLSNSNILFDVLGGNGPRKYLFLFQNNSEMRATGGFIGSYGLLDISNGRVKKFFIDGIFNPDGQLKDRIVPPAPIQKISANWSMHDSNWFADFPQSARKAIYFYEKTGGPTADGVITLTPTLMQKLLEITGPIEMPEYDVTLDSKNFIQLTQFEVEVDYDKAENKPKKILSDLAPLVLDKLLSSRDLESISKMANALLEGLQEKHVLLYSQNSDLQKLISQQGWSGEILPATKDYVSVINTNINGFKTDAIVEENISHKAEIQADGSIIDTLTVVRKHNGGNTPYDWLNKVNADYMRVYVPQGSKLLEVTGQTREIIKAPIDYDSLGFRRDNEIEQEEKNIKIDPESGTRVYDESGKTVFANWTYVSPGETMTTTYKYRLPFSLFQVSVGEQQQIDSYSLVAQKQSGSVGSGFESVLSYPQNYIVKWKFPENSEQADGVIKNSANLKTDHFWGVVFEKN